MFDWVRSLFARPPAGVSRERFDALNARYREVKARYDAAQTNDDNRRHWANADGLSAAAANSPWVRQTLRNRSRYEYDNGAYCNGIIRTRADDLAGTGPTLQILTDDDGLNEAVEQAFASWARAARLAEKLHTMDQARCRDGEAFALLGTNPRLAHPVQLDLVLVEADRVTDPSGNDVPRTEDGTTVLDGVEYDRFGNPLFYTVLDGHPGDLLTVGFPPAARRVPAEFVLHWFRKDRPGQLRGVPELTSSLPLFPYQRRWTLATLAAAEFAASHAGVLETDGPVDPESTVAAPFNSIEIERDMFTELPAGYKLNQLAAEHPNQQYGDFKREVSNECGRPVRMPSNVVSADSSKHNFSSAKLDHFGYRGGIRVDRYFAEVNHLDRVYAAFAGEAALVPGVLPAGVDALALPRAWYWPGWPSMDKDEAKNDTERLNNGTATLQDVLAEWGVDWKAYIRQRGRELKFMADNGVPPPAAGGGDGGGFAARPSVLDALRGTNGHAARNGGA